LVQSTTNAVKVPTRVADRKNQVLMASPCGGCVVGLHWLGRGMRVVSHKTGYPKHTSCAGRGQSAGVIPRRASLCRLRRGPEQVLRPEQVRRVQPLTKR